MIKGVGVDIIEVSRIEKILSTHKESFQKRIYTEKEVQYCNNAKYPQQNFASHFAAKEAVMKVLEIGAGYFRDNGNSVPYIDIEVLHLESGAPRIFLHGSALHAAQKRGIEQVHISLSTLKEYSIAYAIGERKG